jgi:hypothetical protein
MIFSFHFNIFQIIFGTFAKALDVLWVDHKCGFLADFQGAGPALLVG